MHRGGEDGTDISAGLREPGPAGGMLTGGDGLRADIRHAFNHARTAAQIAAEPANP